MVSKARVRRKLNGLRKTLGVEAHEEMELGSLRVPALLDERFIGKEKAPFCFNCDIFVKVNLRGQCVCCGRNVQYVDRSTFFVKQEVSYA